MQIDRRAFLALVGTAACSRGGDPRIRRAADFLWSQQDEDGGWHSRTYGLLRSGQSLTPFVLDALLDLRERPPGIARAVEFLRQHTNVDPVDYPNYATGLAVRAMVRAGAAGWEPMVSYLRAQQLTEENGWKPGDAPYGAWGMGGERRTPPDSGHVDLAMTRYVLEGLATAGVKAPDPALEHALVYLDRCQNPDGGFFFSTVEAAINKAGEADGKFLSYGSTTADGVLALRAAGVAESDSRITRAKKWLRDHHQYGRSPGFDGAREIWGAALRLYYAAAIRRAMPELAVLLPPQRGDGSFVNPSNLVKEDDPLIATAFALRALVAAANQRE
jgi:hypothetical protein